MCPIHKPSPTHPQSSRYRTHTHTLIIILCTRRACGEFWREHHPQTCYILQYLCGRKYPMIMCVISYRSVMMMRDARRAHGKVNSDEKQYLIKLITMIWMKCRAFIWRKHGGPMCCARRWTPSPCALLRCSARSVSLILYASHHTASANVYQRKTNRRHHRTHAHNGECSSDSSEHSGRGVFYAMQTALVSSPPHSSANPITLLLGRTSCCVRMRTQRDTPSTPLRSARNKYI